MGGDRTALPRQQTLRALIDWSHELLTDRERVLFRRLAVFAGGFTLESATAIGQGGGVADADIPVLVTGLVEKSLVEFDAEGERYRLLDTVRQYAQERLGEAGERRGARSHHLAFYLRSPRRQGRNSWPRARGVARAARSRARELALCARLVRFAQAGPKPITA